MGPIGTRTEAVLDDLRALLCSRGVVLGYVFGSVAQGRERPDSDLDIAVLVDRDVPRERYFDLTLDLNTEIIGLTHTDHVDVVVLNNAPPLLVFEVITTGRMFHGRHEDRVEFEVSALKRYYDTEPLRRLQHRAFNTRLDALADALGVGKGKW